MKKTKTKSSNDSALEIKSKEFDNFARLAKALFSVPKKEVDEQEAKRVKNKPKR